VRILHESSIAESLERSKHPCRAMLNVTEDRIVAPLMMLPGRNHRTGSVHRGSSSDVGVSAGDRRAISAG
jgi:hypothetical protein